jgi:membrane fusion protein
MSDLFRKEAILNATRRLPGPVVLATPLSVRVLGLFFGGLLVAAVIFASFATYARKATVTGWLVPDKGMIKATASASGVIQSFAVKEGDVVERGARIAEIRVAAETATGNVGERAIQQIREQLDALRAKTKAKTEQLDAEHAQVMLRIAKLEVERSELQQQTELQAQKVELAREQLTRAEQLAARNNFPQNELDRRRTDVLAAQQELAALRRQIATMERDIAEATARGAAIPLDKNAAGAESRASEADLENRIIDAEARLVLLVISPIAGRIAVLPPALGQQVGIGATVAVVIPEDARLEAELLVPSRGAGFIKPGEEVRLMLQAFPHERFGTVAGKVTTISKAVLGPTELSIPGIDLKEPVFRVRVGLSRDKVQAYGESIPMQPGMLLSADVVFDRRSLIQWLFDPLFAVSRRS